MGKLPWAMGFFLMVFTQLVSAQGCSITITGKVLDDHDFTPLSYTSILVLETGKGTLADEEGIYRLEGLCPGKHTLIASHVGCDPVRIVVDLQGDTILDFFPEHHIELLDLVTAVAYKISDTPAQTRDELSGAALDRLRGKPLAEMLQSLSGMNMVSTGPGIRKPMIHGLFGSRILLVQYNVRQEGQQWGADHAPEIDPTVAGKLSVIKGAEGVRYGPDALGGVVLIEPEPLPRNGGFGGSVYNSLQSNGWGGKIGATLKGGLNRPGWGWRTTGSYQRLGDREAPGYMLSNTGIEEVAWSGQIGYTGNRSTLDAYYSFYRAEFAILRAAHIGNTTDLMAAISAPEPWYQVPFSYEMINPRQKVAHHLARVEFTHQLDKLWDSNLRYSFQGDQRQEFDIRRGDLDTRPALDLAIYSQQLDLGLEHRIYRHFKGTFGVAVQHQWNFNLPGTGTLPLIPDFTNLTTSLFGIERYIRDRYELEAGLRFDYRRMEASRFNASQEKETPTFHFTNLNFSVGGRYRFNRKWTGVWHLGTAFRPPGVHELYSQGLHHATASIEEGNPDLKVERGIKNVLTMRYAGSKTQLEISGYANLIRGFIYLQPEEELRLTIRGAFPVFRYIQTDGLLVGGDITLSHTFNNWLRYEGQASLLSATDLDLDAPLFGMPPFRFRHTLQHIIWNDSARPRGVELQWGVDHVLRQTRVPAFDFAPSPAGYALLFASLTVDVNRWRWIVGVDNALNTRYRDYLDRLRYFADSPGRNVYLKMNFIF
jgi:iron complex outermembrane receptor protein